MGYNIKQKIKNKLLSFVRNSDWYQEKFSDCVKFWNHNTFNVEIVNLGSTSALHSFNYDGLNLNAFNWALRANPLKGDEAVLKNYSSYLNPQNCTVIIPLCPFSSFAGGYEDFDDRYYSILYPSSIPLYSNNRRKSVMDMVNHPLRFFPAKEIIPSIKKRFVKQQEYHAASIADSERRFNAWLKEFDIDDFDAPLSLINKFSIQEAIKTLQRIIDYCNERGFKSIVVVPPMTESLMKKFPEKVLKMLIDDFWKDVDRGATEFINYIGEKQFSDDSLFLDSFLMNEKGAKLFTKHLLSRINVI